MGEVVCSASTLSLPFSMSRLYNCVWIYHVRALRTNMIDTNAVVQTCSGERVGQGAGFFLGVFWKGSMRTVFLFGRGGGGALARFF
jgi:hypothetical protein